MRAPIRLDYLDGWRVAAILMVFADHLGMNHAIGAFYEKSPLGVTPNMARPASSSSSSSAAMS